MDAMVTAKVEIPFSLGSTLTEEQARQIAEMGEEASIWAMLQLAKMLAEKQSPSDAANSHDTPATPSGMQPPFKKPNASTGRKKKPGQKAGHSGSRRNVPDRVDHRTEHRAETCPDCGGPLNRCNEARTRYTEDIPENVQAECTEHTIHRDWCPRCKKKVEGVVDDALPGSSLGLRVLVLTAWMHYALGNTLSQITEVLNYHLQIKASPGGLVQMWYRLQAILYGWYEDIQQQALRSGVLHGDETGWRVNGKTHWLWCFTTDTLTYYMIHRSRGHPALLEFFTTEFSGVLVTDFWGAYNAVACALRQGCLVHLLRDLKHVEKYKSTAQDWPQFAKKLRRLIADAIRLWQSKAELPPDRYASRRERLNQRLADIISTPWTNKEARRLIKRLRRHQDDLFTFLDHEGVPFENNHAEREIRPAVIIRKNSYGNRSQAGADCQAVLMTVFRTLKKRGHSPIVTITKALRTYLQTEKLPPLPN